MIFSGLWALTALFPSDGGCGMQDSCRDGVSSCRWWACGGVGRLTIYSGVVWWSVVFRRRDYYNDRGGGAALATASLVSAAMVVSFLDAFCWWGVCVCLLLFIQDIVVGWDSAKIRAVEESTSRGNPLIESSDALPSASWTSVFCFVLFL
jgi:hypothetical protein